MAEPTLSGAPQSDELLRFARDILVRVGADPSIQRRVDLRLLVTKPRPMNAIIFVDVLDASGSIQLFAEERTTPAPVWESLVALKPFDRIHVKGFTIQTKSRQAAVTPSELTVAVPAGAAPVAPDPLSDLPLAKQFFLSQLRRRTSEFLRGEQFQEYEPDCLCLSQESPMTSLQVIFPGWGAPVSLAISPIRQLLDAVLLTSVPSVFSVGRCFSHAVRDGFTSAEEVVLCLVRLHSSLDELIHLAKRCVEFTFAEALTQPAGLPDLAASQWVDAPAGSPELFRVERPTVQRLSRGVPAHDGQSQACFRLLLPPAISVAEGHAGDLHGQLSLGGITIHLERMVRLLSAVRLSRIRL